MAEDKRKVFALIHPGFERSWPGHSEESIEEKDYPDEYIDRWKNLIDWISETDNTHLIFEEYNTSSPKFKEDFDELSDYVKDNLSDEKLTFTTKSSRNTSEIDEKISQDKILGGEDPEDVLLYGCGEYAYSCVSDKLKKLEDSLDLPRENIFIHQDLSLPPLPEDAEDFSEYAKKRVQEEGWEFGWVPSVGLREKNFKEEREEM